MTHLTPEERRAVSHFRAKADRLSPAGAKPYTLAADAISDRAALAVQVVVLREALEQAKCYITLYRDEHQAMYGSMNEADMLELMNDIKAAEIALALSLPQAAQQVAEWKEKAELLPKASSALLSAIGMIRMQYNGPMPPHWEATFALLLDDVSDIQESLNPTAAKEASDE